jgi:cold shock protein
MAERMVGTLEWLNGDKGYGFIIQENGEDVLIPYRAPLGEGFRILTAGNKFSFTIQDGPHGGLMATNVTPA